MQFKAAGHVATLLEINRRSDQVLAIIVASKPHVKEKKKASQLTCHNSRQVGYYYYTDEPIKGKKKKPASSIHANYRRLIDYGK